MRYCISLAALFLYSVSFGQFPGSLLIPASPATNPMNPNGDGYVTISNATFAGPLDETQFEISFLPIPQFETEPFSALGITSTTLVRMAATSNGDVISALGGGATDIGGVNGHLIASDDNQFIAAITGSPRIPLANAPPTAASETVSIDENSTEGLVVHTVEAIDVNGDALTYSIVGDNIGVAFLIDATTGAISVNSSAALDFESSPVFVLAVEVSDGESADEVLITVNLTDINEPPAMADATVPLSENSSYETVVHTAHATDPDVGALLTFSITDGNVAGAFAINNSGVITVSNQDALNYETKPELVLTVRVSDGILFHDATVTVKLTDVNEFPFLADATITLSEHAENGAYVCTLAASDPDRASVLTYAILAGNTGSVFVVDAVTGIVSVNDNTTLDFESASSFVLTVGVDDGALMEEAMLTISLTNINEPPSAINAAVFVDENSENGTLVHTIGGTDPDAGTVLSYAVISGDVRDAFSVDEASGVITVQDSKALDYESFKSAQLIVRVSDGDLHSDAVIEIAVKDINEPPSVTDAEILLARPFNDGQVIYAMMATDPDEGDFLSFGMEETSEDHFISIDVHSGEITIEDAMKLSNIEDSFSVVIIATDAGGMTGRGTLRINMEPHTAKLIEPQRGFSPNGDSNNDFWMIKGIEDFPGNVVRVFNRWGVRVYEARDYDNLGNVWRGEVRGVRVQSEGTYYYVISAPSLSAVTGYVVVKP